MDQGAVFQIAQLRLSHGSPHPEFRIFTSWFELTWNQGAFGSTLCAALAAHGCI